MSGESEGRTTRSRNTQIAMRSPSSARWLTTFDLVQRTRPYAASQDERLSDRHEELSVHRTSPMPASSDGLGSPSGLSVRS